MCLSGTENEGDFKVAAANLRNQKSINNNQKGLNTGSSGKGHDIISVSVYNLGCLKNAAASMPPSALEGGNMCR